MDSLMIIIPTVAGIGGCIIGYFLRNLVNKQAIERELEATHREAEVIRDKAQKEAELLKKTKILEVKDEWFKEKTKYDKEVNAQREKIKREREKVQKQRQEADTLIKNVESREKELDSWKNEVQEKEAIVKLKEKEVEKVIATQNEKLEAISHMSQDEARKTLMSNLEDKIRYECAQIIKESRDDAKRKAEKEAREMVLRTMQRCAAEVTVEKTVSVVHLPSDDMKGRIIGREGRNIRAFEEATGIDVIVDDTPEAVILSCFNPVRREVARLALEKLIEDGRIHPGRIEEVIKQADAEVKQGMIDAAEEVLFDLQIHIDKPQMIETIGKLKYRTSYGQNILLHSKEVALLSGIIASNLGLDTKLAVRAGFLHDLGKAIDREVEGTHSELGYKLAKKFGENDIVCNAIAAHHEDVVATSLYPVVVQIADTISSTRPGVRRETMSNYVTRLSNLESIVDSFTGVTKSFVIQAGREVRVMVEPDEVADAQAEEMGRQIAERIEGEMEYPGQIKVVIVRESRYTEFAK